MNKNMENQWDMEFDQSKPSAMDLRGRQSVRATFRLPEACIDAITILSAQLGIKQKSVFDFLMEDVQILQDIARELENIEIDTQEHIQKTFVISRRSLSFLDSISSEYDASRDALVEFSVRRLIPIIAKERTKHEKRKELLAEISDHLKEGEKVVSKADDILGTDDPVVSKLKAAMSVYKNAFDDIVRIIERGKIIEEFQLK